MPLEFGVLFAIAALVFWGLGDFLIQRSTRKIGDWETTLAIGLFGTIVLLPFIYKDITFLFSFQDRSFLILAIVSVTMLIATLLDFEALKKGKIAIVEPIMALEVPVAALLALTLMNEIIGKMEIFLITLIISGLILVSLRGHHFQKKAWIEKGAMLAIIAALFMGLSNFVVGFASRISNPLLTIWFVWAFISLVSLLYLAWNNRLHHFLNDIITNLKLCLSIGFLDTAAWVSFAFALTALPIAIAVALSESYIAFAALLGIWLNKEMLLNHQKVGLIVTLTSAIILAGVTA